MPKKSQINEYSDRAFVDVSMVEFVLRREHGWVLETSDRPPQVRMRIGKRRSA
jgi:hypothetical protein